MDSGEMKREAERLNLAASRTHLEAGYEEDLLRKAYRIECEAYGKLLGAYGKLEREKKEVKESEELSV